MRIVASEANFLVTKYSTLLFSPTFFQKWLCLNVKEYFCNRTGGRMIELKSSMIFLAIWVALGLKKNGAAEIRSDVIWI